MHGAFQRKYYVNVPCVGVHVRVQVNVELQAVTETRHVTRMRDYSTMPSVPAGMQYAPAGGVHMHMT